MKLLYYSPASYGGIADYAHEQANALAAMGIDVIFLCTPEYPKHRTALYRRIPTLKELKSRIEIASKPLRMFRYFRITLGNYRKLFDLIREGRYQYVLMGSYAEYLAPLWAKKFCDLESNGTIFGAIVHDPVRDFIVGPSWWHKWSISQAYSFIKHAFVHDEIKLDAGKYTSKVVTTVVPLGMYHFPTASQSKIDARKYYDLPIDAKVILAFGHIRDGKNLDLLIKSIDSFPNCYLLVAGKEQSSGQKNVAFYKELSKRLKVDNRCRWQIRFLPEIEVANLFEACDIVALTYSKNFRSASSVLSVATNYRKPCLASSGEGSLKKTVTKYNLGVWVKPDDCGEIKKGLTQLMDNPPIPRWDDYFEEKSWHRNAKHVIDAFKQENFNDN